jgi:type I restriction enzyme, S subunit
VNKAGMSDWKTYKLREFTDINPRVYLKQGNEYSFVEMKDLNATFKCVSPSAKRELKGGSKFQNGDILFARITPCLENGKICQVKNLENNVGFGSTEFLVFRGKENVSDNDFVYYLSRSEFVKNNAVQMMTGTSGRQRVEKSALEQLEITAPDLPTQKEIAQILSSLDDKIELNLQMNQTLEAMAKAIFKEWFVNFNFPGFDGELVDGLPKGWRMGNVLEIATLLSGGTPKTNEPEYWDGDINWISAKDITSSNNQFIIETEKTITELGIKKSAAKLLPTYTTIISARGTVGNFCILPKEMAISQSNYGLKSNSNFDFFLFLLVKDMILMMKAFAYGAVFDTITTRTFQAMEITIPDNQIIEEFEKFVKPIYSKILTNQLQIQSLTQTRDTLLPKLMSGQLEVV